MLAGIWNFENDLQRNKEHGKPQLFGILVFAKNASMAATSVGKRPLNEIPALNAVNLNAFGEKILYANNKWHFSKKALILSHELVILSLLKKGEKSLFLKKLRFKIFHFTQYDNFQHFFIKEPNNPHLNKIYPVLSYAKRECA